LSRGRAVEGAEARDGRAAADKLGLEETAVVAVRPFEASERRTLHVYTKTSATPRATRDAPEWPPNVPSLPQSVLSATEPRQPER
jgi:hypothetical protein